MNNIPVFDDGDERELWRSEAQDHDEDNDIDNEI
jgi:hypothetical protein